jgi:hypothetical protein
LSKIQKGPTVTLAPGHEVDVLGTDYVLANIGSVSATVGLLIDAEQKPIPHSKGSGAFMELRVGQELVVPQSKLRVFNVGPLVARVRLVSKTWRREQERGEFARRAAKEADLGFTEKLKRGRYRGE